MRIDDQTAINEALKETKTPAFQLPKSLFPTGYDFFIKYQYYWDRREDELYIFHNNYVIGKRNKELRMREMHLYVVDVDGEYSDPTRK